MKLLYFLIALFFIFLLNWNKYANVKRQNILLLGTFLFLFFQLEYYYSFLLLLVLLSNYYLVINLEKKVANTIILYYSMLLNIGLIILFKIFVFKQLFYSFDTIYFLGILFLPIRCIFYVFEIRNKRIQTVNDFIIYANYIIFYPLYFLGNFSNKNFFLEQLKVKRKFDRNIIVDGLRQILWGSFKVLVIAGNSAIYSDQIFNSYTNKSSSDLLLGVLFYIFQVYGYLSGYFDLLMGGIKLFGFSFKDKSQISYILSPIKILKDFYLFITVSLKKIGNYFFSKSILYGMIVLCLFILGTFFTKSLINAIVFSLFNVSILYCLNNAKHKIKKARFLGLSLNLLIILINGVLIRSKSFYDFTNYLFKIFNSSFFSFPHLNKSALATLILIALFCLIEYIGRKNTYAIKYMFLRIQSWLRWSFYSFIIMLIILFN